MEETYQKTVLPNGIRVITESLPYVRSVTIGLLIETGSRYESEKLNGVTHFIEHMLFKGTRKRTARQIAADIDAIGGLFDAFTSREYFGIAIKVLDEKVNRAVSILADVLLQPTFDPQLFDREKSVILEEIKMIQDTPDELIHDLLMEVIWKDHPLGRPISGTVDTIQRLSCENIVSFYEANMQPHHITISVAGNLKHTKIVSLFKRYFGNLDTDQIKNEQTPPTFHSGTRIVSKELEQVHLCLAYKGLEHTHTLRYVSFVYATLLGGSMSSHLFQKIREQYGLVYAIYAYRSAYKDAGFLSVYAACSPQNVNSVMELSQEIIARLALKKISKRELERVKAQLKGNLVLGLESTYNRMNALAKQEIYFNRHIPLDEFLENIDRISAKDILEYGEAMLQWSKPSLVLIGPVTKNDLKHPIAG